MLDRGRLDCRDRFQNVRRQEGGWSSRQRCQGSKEGETPASRETSGCVWISSGGQRGHKFMRALAEASLRSKLAPHCLAHPMGHPIAIIKCGFHFCRSGWGLSTCISNELPARQEGQGPGRPQAWCSLSLRGSSYYRCERPQLLWGFKTNRFSNFNCFCGRWLTEEAGLTGPCCCPLGCPMWV